MTFQESIRVCFSKYADFQGTASRSEYWWFALALAIVATIAYSLSYTLYIIFALGTLLPSVAVATRRLHDTGRSGWWQLIAFVPFVGIIVLIVFLAQEGKPAEPVTTI